MEHLKDKKKRDKELEKVQERAEGNLERLKHKDKVRFRKIRTAIKRNSKKKSYPA